MNEELEIPSERPSHEIGWELAHAEKPKMDLRPTAPDVGDRILHPIRSHRDVNERALLEALAKKDSEETRVCIELCSEMQSDPKVLELYPKLIGNLRKIDEVASGELEMISKMSAHELYKYQPKSIYCDFALGIALAVHESGATILIEDASSFAPDTLSSLHRLCETSIDRGRIPTVLGEESQTVTPTDLGFMIVEEYLPKEDKVRIVPMIFLVTAVRRTLEPKLKVSIVPNGLEENVLTTQNGVAPPQSA